MAHFPLTAKYDKAWVKENSLGENILYNMESLCQVLSFHPGMRVLDLGCGNAISSIFLAKEFGVKVWAVDKGVSPSDNWKRICESACSDRVFPLKVDAKHLPFPREFFDVLVAADSVYYYGTDDRFLPYIIQFLSPEGLLAVVDSCFLEEVKNQDTIPASIKGTYAKYWFYVHSLDWWRAHWEKTGLVTIRNAELLPHYDYIWKEFIKDYESSDNQADLDIVKSLQEDQGQNISLFRLVAQRNQSLAYLEPFEYGG